MTTIRGITAYNTFIKDAFNIIYNRPCLNILPKDVKNVICKYKNIRANIVIIELAKIWKRNTSKTIVFRYKTLIQKIGLFTNQIYNNIAIYNTIYEKNNKNVYLFLSFNLIFPFVYILSFLMFLIICLS